MGVVASTVAGFTALAIIAGVDLWSDRVLTRALLELVERISPFRPNGSYRSRALPEKYAVLRRKKPDG
ncbi:hypothetical protein HZF05_14525 [Sphingomonas sp. CGMCC 1.13654]|uniref:Uncharacterized protein n=1 Tax=Sphingomonas chungangi TaxID=2683589 RepID=A0A838L8R2_9SPHN|nr:hypothetical protein [Sphingomonas chungangi]MBA2935300.1 hypothetical protein [Sphingomonas chungangi]MVW56807.1 hypothetical protein [Sphingomonas chungangi]